MLPRRRRSIMILLKSMQRSIAGEDVRTELGSLELSQLLMRREQPLYSLYVLFPLEAREVI